VGSTIRLRVRVGLGLRFRGWSASGILCDGYGCVSRSKPKV
jgi:hypothetical protein